MLDSIETPKGTNKEQRKQICLAVRRSNTRKEKEKKQEQEQVTKNGGFIISK